MPLVVFMPEHLHDGSQQNCQTWSHINASEQVKENKFEYVLVFTAVTDSQNIGDKNFNTICIVQYREAQWAFLFFNVFLAKAKCPELFYLVKPRLPLQIPRSGGFHSCVDQSFSAGHAVEEELLNNNTQGKGRTVS